MSTTLPPGFKSFPVSSVLIQITVALPLLASLSASKYIYFLAYDPFIVEYHQFWRLLTFQLAFVNESEVFVSLLLLYQLRNLERLFSSHKYLSLIIVVFLYNLFLTSCLIPLKYYTGITWFNEASTGPVAIIFALLAQYAEHIPVIYKFEIHGIKDNKLILTDQFLIHVLAFQSAISQGWRSIGSAFVGWVLGSLISRGFIPGKGWRVPFWKQLTKTTITSRRDIHTISRENTPSDSNQEEEDEEATETRPLASQFLDTFRR